MQLFLTKVAINLKIEFSYYFVCFLFMVSPEVLFFVFSCFKSVERYSARPELIGGGGITSDLAHPTTAASTRIPTTINEVFI